MDLDHLRTPEAMAARKAARDIRNTKPTATKGIETVRLDVGTPVRIAGSGVSSAYSGRDGWVASVNTETYENGLAPYTEYGVTFTHRKDWKKAATDAWFRFDELRILP